MHDTFLNARIYENLLKLCQTNKICKVTKVEIDVNEDSHISETSLREYFSDQKSQLIGAWTRIVVERKDVGKLQAIINSIEGESQNE